MKITPLNPLCCKSRESIRTHNEKIRRYRITLFETACKDNITLNSPIDLERKRHTGNTIHNSSHPTFTKVQSQHHSLQKPSFNPIIQFSRIKFKSKRIVSPINIPFHGMKSVKSKQNYLLQTSPKFRLYKVRRILGYKKVGFKVHKLRVQCT